MPKEELSKIDQIVEAAEDVKNALIADLKAKERIIEVNREKTATRFTLQKAKQRLATLELELSS